jgi:predicted MPP superfamily phosphohydrolase
MGPRINVLSVILGALHAYIGVRLLAPFGLPVQVAGALVLVTVLWLLPKGFGFRGRYAWQTWVPWLMTGFFSWLLVLTFGRDILLMASVFFTTPQVHDAWIRISALAVMALAPVITAIGYAMARRTAPVVDVMVPIEGLAAALEGFTIAQISDIHVGPTIKGPYVRAIVDAVNALSADAVAVTGDLVDGRVRDLAAHVAPLAALRSRHGTFFVTGNHEYYSGADEWIAELKRLGVQVLLNEHVVLRHDGAQLVMAGVADSSAHRFDPQHRSDPQRAMHGAPASAGLRVLLAHQPRSAEAAANAGFDVQLSGHTHGGQYWPWNLFVQLQQPYTAGLHRLKQLWIYTSRGTGYWGPPLRLGAPSEITRLRFVGAA